MTRRRGYVLVEGQTEEQFVHRLLIPDARINDLELTPVILKTKRLEAGGHFRGGVASMKQIDGDLRELLRDRGVAVVTTMLDYYGLPRGFPGRQLLRSGMPPQERATTLERAWATSVDDKRFVPYLSLHEFEALLFVRPSRFSHLVGAHAAQALTRIAKQFSSPEHIDDGAQTHPSARIRAAFPGYQKPTMGVQATEAIGLEALRRGCPHFDNWLNALDF